MMINTGHDSDTQNVGFASQLRNNKMPTSITFFEETFSGNFYIKKCTLAENPKSGRIPSNSQ